MAQHDGRSVRRDFDDVVRGVRVGLGEVGDDDLVDACLSCGGFDQIAGDGSTGFQRLLETQHGRGNGARFRTGQADYADAAASGRGGDGDDGVIQIHTNILAV